MEVTMHVYLARLNCNLDIQLFREAWKLKNGPVGFDFEFRGNTFIARINISPESAWKLEGNGGFRQFLQMVLHAFDENCEILDLTTKQE
jgi:hypothetical protein